MDILTQAVLGAGVAVAVTKAKSPRKAAVLGAMLAIFPDLDLLIPYDNPVDLLINHRTWSHSWLIHALVAPLFAYIFIRIEPVWKYKTACLMVFLVLTTHAGLDALTVFGTNIFWPLSNESIVGGSVFIIDPIYTVSLLSFFVLAIWKPKFNHLWKSSLIVLLLSSTYLLWGFTAKILVEEKAINSLNLLGVNTQNMLTHTTPFNTLLWRILVIDEDSYYEGFYSILSNGDNINFKASPRHLELLGSLKNSATLKKLVIFNHGFYSISENAEGLSKNIIMNDLRKSYEDTHTFRFHIGTVQGVNITEVKPNMLERPELPKGFYKVIWKRIFNEI